MMDITLNPLRDDDRARFILENQAAFRYGAEEDCCRFGAEEDDELCEELSVYSYAGADEEIISRETIERTIDAGEAYRIMLRGEPVGGLVLRTEGARGVLELLFVSPELHSCGIGYAAWCAVEALYPDIRVWEACTPYFEKRNIHFYVNRCGFRIVEFYNEKHPDPHEPDCCDDGMFRFEKRL